MVRHNMSITHAITLSCALVLRKQRSESYRNFQQVAEALYARLLYFNVSGRGDIDRGLREG